MISLQIISFRQDLPMDTDGAGGSLIKPVVRTLKLKLR